MYDLCIIGAGMIGSAAARHATVTSGLNTCLIGPTEPKNRGSDKTSGIYGSYFDEGRITRCMDKDAVWSTLARESIQRYRDLEQQSGIKFYHEVGNLMIGGRSYLNKTDEVASRNAIPTQKLDIKLLKQRFPYLRLTEDTNGRMETKKAGYVNPRRMVKAQKTMAAKQGCTIIDDVVNHVTRIVQSDGSYVMLIKTEKGLSIWSKKVLLATGAFTTFRDVLPDVRPEHIISPLLVSLLEVEEANLKMFTEMPCIIYYGRANEVWQVPASHKTKDEISFYMMPPIKYPNGKYYIKLGLRDAASSESIKTPVDVTKWFKEGNKVTAKHVTNFTKSLFDGVDFKSWQTDSCVITETPTTHPYIDMIHAQLGVAIGGNGFAAKSSDEIGRLGVSMMTSQWDSTIPRDIFKIKLLPTYPSEYKVTTLKGKL